MSATGLAPVIKVDESLCVNCHMCIAVCPVKICIDGSGEKVQMNHELCIGCGRCIEACTHGARKGIDDMDAFMDAVRRKQPMIALVAPAVAAKYPDDWKRFNGWLASLGVRAIFDVSFGAELTVESYLRYIDEKKPPLVIAQPCPAIVTYIELYQPELLPYLAPADSPMLHTIKHAFAVHPEYRNHTVVVVSPCVAKRREFHETGFSFLNVTLEHIDAYLKAQHISVHSFPEREFDSPDAERAVLFSMPGGLMETVKRERPALVNGIRKIEGPDVVYPYFKDLPASLRKKINPLLIDCLNCEKGCDGGTGTGLQHASVDELEYGVRKRAETQKEKLARRAFGKGGNVRSIRRLISSSWKDGMFGRTYKDRSGTVSFRTPTDAQLQPIYESMKKYAPEDFLNCAACGYGSCKDMAIAIFNNLNKRDNCQHYRYLEISGHRTSLGQMTVDMDREFAKANSLLSGIIAFLPELRARTAEQHGSLEESRRMIETLLRELAEASRMSSMRQDELRNLLVAASSVQGDVEHSLHAVSSLQESVKGVHDLVNRINTIAAQTNLLSMNASIEAAHAGNFGAGFAVVAAEIRTLADQAGKSAASISSSLHEMSKAVEETDLVTRRSTSNISGVFTQLTDTSQGMKEFFTALGDISSETGGVGAALDALTKAVERTTESYAEIEVSLDETWRELQLISDISRENVQKIASA